MNKESLLSIGEVASICNVSHKTLRYYNDIGVLRPALVDSENKYRYYKKSQITKITTIKELQRMDISLSEIKRVLESTEEWEIVENLSELLRNKEKEIKCELERLNNNLNKVEVLRTQCEKIKKIIINKNDDIVIKKIPSRKVIYKTYEGKYNKDIFREYYSSILNDVTENPCNIFKIKPVPLAILESQHNLDNVKIKIGYEVNLENQIDYKNKCEIKEGYYACYVYKGEYKTLRNNLYERIHKNISKRGYEIYGPSIELYYINENISSYEKAFITEVQVPIKINS